jgi:hypothetical protein
MRILLDECLPRRLRDELAEHEVRTVPEMGWAGKKNGELLALAAGRFDALLTIDAGIAFQQNVGAAALGVMALSAPNNRLETLRSLMPRVRALLPTVEAGQWMRVTA